jgi:sRNA-binding protein
VKMSTKPDTNIAALAALFPLAFSPEPCQAHRPLKVGIGNDLVVRGVLGEAALKRYVNRLMYQKCLAAGGAPVDLEGNVAGRVSTDQRCRAEGLVARIKARQVAEAAPAKAVPENKEAVRQAAAPTSNGKVVSIPPPAQTTPSTGSGRLGLTELKRAAQERRARQEAIRGHPHKRVASGAENARAVLLPTPSRLQTSRGRASACSRRARPISSERGSPAAPSCRRSPGCSRRWP